METSALQSASLRSPATFATGLAVLRRGALSAFLAAAVSACSGASAAPVVTVHTARGDASVEVELALTREEQARGLMFRTELADDAGMLFVFDGDADRSFWMRNTPRSLDIFYIRSDSTIVSIAANTTPYSEKQIPSRGPARYVLEVNAGWAARHGAKPGDRVTLPEVPVAKKGD